MKASSSRLCLPELHTCLAPGILLAMQAQPRINASHSEQLLFTLSHMEEDFNFKLTHSETFLVAQT